MKTKLLFTLLIAFSFKSFSQTFNYDNYRDFVLAKYESDFKKHYNKKSNLLVKNGIIHIFIDDKGNPIETGIPTTATEKNTYKIHLITDTQTESTEIFEFSVQGEYKPTLNIQNETDVEPFGFAGSEPSLKEYVYATVGPFTTEFTFTIKRKKRDDPSNETVIITRTINVAKTYHVSISTGLFMTTLQNPSNIKESTNSNGETTLIADDVNTRGIVALNAVFYPKGRSFLFPPSGGIFSPERFGILVGTQIDKDQFENFIGGIQFDFARGGSVAFGAHYGRRNTISGYDKFDFGNEKFEGNIDTDIVKEWNVGFFIGANLDLRIFGQLFKATE